MKPYRRRPPAAAALAACFVLLLACEARAQGLSLNGVGPVNRSMGGAATAAPLDAAGALHWNPASIAALPHSEISFGMELLLPDSELSSTFPGMSPGSTESEPGAAPIPAFAFVHHDCDSCWSYGLGMFGIAGYRVNYPSDPTNPILSPPPPNGISQGQLFAEAELFQLVPTVAYVVNQNLSIGFAPTATLARVSMDPAYLSPPNGPFDNPSAQGTRYHWGVGAQAGIYYTTDVGWHFGLSVKSPQWFEEFRFNSEDAMGNPRLLRLKMDYPLIASLGVAYSGIECWTLALDVRYFDWANTDGFKTASYDLATGAVTGLGWRNLFALAAGAQYQMTPCLSVRAGYSFNENPIADGLSGYNFATPLITQHVASAGFSYQMHHNWVFSVAYIHGFENTVTGPIIPFPGVPVPGSSVSSEVSADALSAGVTVRF